MLIDTLKRDIPYVHFPDLPFYIKDTITFKINQTASDFLELYLEKQRYFEAYENFKLPYNNIFLQLDGSGLWFVQLDDDSICSCAFSTHHDISDTIGDSPEVDGFIRIHNGYTVHEGNAYIAPLVNDGPGDIPDSPEKTAMATHCAILDQFLNVLSCKNIRTVKIPGAPKRKRHKKPLHSYYVLQIADRVKSAKGKAKNIWSNRVHLCCGHIKTYTAERPLFGHYVGNVWCPPHARGNKDNGVIHKDYKL